MGVLYLLFKVQKIKKFYNKDFTGRKYKMVKYTKDKLLREAYLFSEWYLPRKLRKKKLNKFKKRSSSTLNKLSLFQKNDSKFSKKKCPFSIKNAPIIDYKNVSLLKKYVTDNRKIISSKITSVSFNKQRKLNREIKKAKILGLI